MKLVLSIVAFAIILVAASTLGNVNMTEAKKSYKLIVYLDGAYKGSSIGNHFNIVVYNSNSKIILSAKPKIDFNDGHQKISPKSGYSISDKNGQHPSQIEVCAQQKYAQDGRTYTHDDCYNIQQNKAKTYWYTIFDFGKIDGFEAD